MKENMIDVKQREVMYILQEECAEVTQAVSKIFRFGYDSAYPVDGFNNREKLTEEVGDLVAMIRLLVDFKVIEYEGLEKAAERKMKKLENWSKLFND